MPDFSFVSLSINQVAIITIGLLLLLTILLAFLYFHEHSKNQKGQLKLLEKARQKGLQLIYTAMKKAQAITQTSELESIKIIASAGLDKEKIEKETLQAIHDATYEAKEAVSQAQSVFTDYLQQLSQQATTSSSESEKMIKERINKLFYNFEQNLSTYLTDTQQQSIHAITLEVAAARQLIETYKTEQFRLVDENIVAMLERTLSLVLVKKLTLKEHVDLVYESLEKAKVEKFII